MENGQSVFFLWPHTPARFARVRLLGHALPISLLILRKKPTVLQSTAEMTCNGYMSKHQRNFLVSPLKNLSKMDDYHLPLSFKNRSRDHFILELLNEMRFFFVQDRIEFMHQVNEYCMVLCLPQLNAISPFHFLLFL